MAKRILGWNRELLGAHGRIAGLFARSEPRARSLAYVQGLLRVCERKNGWQLAEWMGEPAPYRVQHRLDRACWDADAARDQVREYVLDALSSEESVRYVLAVACDQRLRWPDWQPRRADAIAEHLPALAWERVSAGSGSKGERLYDWALLPGGQHEGWSYGLLVRRSLEAKPEHAYYRFYAPAPKANLQTQV